MIRLALLAVALTAAAPPERVLRSETRTGIFVGWERGDYLWARVGRGAAAFSAMPGPDPIGPFLEANRGRPVTVTVATVDTSLPEAGRTQIRRITGVRNRAETAASWWRRLGPAQRRAATLRFEAALP
jgi:hypothetical protein